MKLYLILPLLLVFWIPQQTKDTENLSIKVLAAKWSKARHVVENPNNTATQPPASAMNAANKNFARNVRINDPAGVRDPNADTLDTRSAEIERNVQEARSPHQKEVVGVSYRVKVRNEAEGLVEVLFWEYQFTDPADPENVTRHQFMCGVSIGAGKDKELEGFSTASPSSVVNVNVLAAKKQNNPFHERVLINRVEFADGTIWQRKDWSLKEVKTAYDRVLKEAWVPGMCKAL